MSYTHIAFSNKRKELNTYILIKLINFWNIFEMDDSAHDFKIEVTQEKAL